MPSVIAHTHAHTHTRTHTHCFNIHFPTKPALAGYLLIFLTSGFCVVYGPDAFLVTASATTLSVLSRQLYTKVNVKPDNGDMTH